jgi:transcriptional regulator with XRE-family HTH domain
VAAATPSPRDQFAANLRRDRRLAGLSVDRLAYLTERTPEEIEQLERGEFGPSLAGPDLATGIRLSAVLEVSLARLTDGIESPLVKPPAAGVEAATNGRGAT